MAAEVGPHPSPPTPPPIPPRRQPQRLLLRPRLRAGEAAGRRKRGRMEVAGLMTAAEVLRTREARAGAAGLPPGEGEVGGLMARPLSRKGCQRHRGRRWPPRRRTVPPPPSAGSCRRRAWAAVGVGAALTIRGGRSSPCQLSNHCSRTCALGTGAGVGGVGAAIPPCRCRPVACPPSRVGPAGAFEAAVGRADKMAPPDPPRLSGLAAAPAAGRTPRWQLQPQRRSPQAPPQAAPPPRLPRPRRRPCLRPRLHPQGGWAGMEVATGVA